MPLPYTIEINLERYIRRDIFAKDKLDNKSSRSNYNKLDDSMKDLIKNLLPSSIEISSDRSNYKNLILDEYRKNLIKEENERIRENLLNYRIIRNINKSEY